MKMEEGRGKMEEGRWKREDGRRKRKAGRRKPKQIHTQTKKRNVLGFYLLLLVHLLSHLILHA